jgi:hypothetical protein
MTKSGMMRNCVYIFLLLMASVGCKVDDAEYLYKDELGALTKSFTIDSQTGSLSFKVYANKAGKASVMEGKEWLNVVTPSFDGDATIKVDYLYNDGFPRKGSVLLETSTRRDTVHIMQEGRLKELFEFPQTSVVVYNGKGDTVIPAECNVEISEVDIDVNPRLDKGCLLINISYTIAQTNARDNMVFPFYLYSGTEEQENEGTESL